MLTNTGMNITELKKCYLCKGSELFQRSGTVYNAPELKVLECSSCGLVFLSSHEHINENFYQDSGMHQDGPDLSEIESWIKDTEWDDERRFLFLKASLVNKIVLDFGCGAGGFLLKAQKVAGRAEGVELESRLQSHFRKHNLHVFSDLTELQNHNEKKKYDYISLFHVLEHLHDPRTILKELTSLLNSDGQIIVEVPNANDALISTYKNEHFLNHIYRNYHLFMFTAETLSKLAFQSGLTVNYIKQVQRYPLSNHMYWLANGKPGGHQRWSFLDSDNLHFAYEKQLAAIGGCDTVVGSFSKRSQ
jgi:2-polyprenyl-3-methyl-5-hydroxy-6-metoxy-1,4-benzoquinol methylase